MERETLTVVTCYHCGEKCLEEHRVFEAKDFCCPGCEVVYQLLQESGLCDYYALSERPGVKQRSTLDEQRTELFDLPEVREKLVEFSEGGITRVRFHVPQMHCSSCIWLLENLHRLEPAILRSRVSFTSKEIRITFREERFSLGRLVGLLRRIGYGPQLTGAAQRTTPVSFPRPMQIRLGVAGFIFGNTMLFSFPEYLGADTEAGLKSGLQWLSVLFSIPVVFFLSTDFFRSAWAGIRARVVNIDQPIALGIVALWTRSLWEVISGYGPGYFDSLAGLLFFLLIGRWYQAYTYRALRFDRALDDFLPLIVLRKTMTGEAPVRVSDLRPGDRIVVRDHELVPVDAVLRSGQAHIDNSFITGEPLPLRKQVGETITAGGRQRGAAIELEVLRSFADSRLKKLWAEQATVGERSAMPRLIETVARRFTVAVLLIAAGAALYWWGKDSQQVWLVVTSVLIVACPCALALSMPFAYGHTIRLLGQQGLFLRDAGVVERLANIQSVVFDKTGTLTAREAYAVQWCGRALTEAEYVLARSLARNSTHPLSAALARELKGPMQATAEAQDHPGLGVEGRVAGRPVRLGAAGFCGGEEAEREPGEAHVHFALDGIHLGHFSLHKQTRTGIADAVKSIRNRLRVALITGDVSVDHDLAAEFQGAPVRTQCSPADKTEAIRSEQRDGHRVLMVGDGLNDAGALAQSDVSITVTETSAALTPASDAIMDARSVAELPHFLRMARRAQRIVIASLLLSLGYNVVGVSFAVSGALTPLIAAILMPMSSVTVVGFVTAAVGIAARRYSTG